MTFPDIKLVDAPTASATVLFDFNDITATPKREVLADDFSIGTPELVGEVDAVDPLYGERMVKFVCAMTGTKPQVAAAQSTLSRLLLAPGRGWLAVRVTPTSRLLFFRTYRAEPGDLSLEFIKSTSATIPDRWEVEINLPCEPFAYGERVNQAAQVVSSDPTAGTNPLRIVLPAISGDAPTPLDIALTSPTSFTAPTAYTVMSNAGAAARATVSNSIGTGDGGTARIDTGAPVASATYAGGSYRVISFATDATYAPRLDLTFGAGLTQGRYRVFVRVAASAVGSKFEVGFTGFERVPERGIFQPDSNNPTWVDLGVVATHVNLAASPNVPAATTPTILTIWASRTIGTASLNIDHILFVPVEVADTVESRAMRVISRGSFTSGSLYIDGTYGEVIPRNTTSGIETSGVFVRGIPGAGNVLNFIFSTSPYAADVITRNVTAAVSYYPRFLYLGDS